MLTITITEDSLANIIDVYCSCGGRGPDDDPCPACSIWHDILRFTDLADLANTVRGEQADTADKLTLPPYPHNGMCSCGECLEIYEIRKLELFGDTPAVHRCIENQVDVSGCDVLCTVCHRGWRR